MNTSRKNTRVNLEHGQFLNLPDGNAVDIACDSGSVWITQDGSLLDVVLGPGERYTWTRPGPILAYALKNTVLTTTTIATPNRRGWKLPLLQRIAASFETRRPALG